MKILLTGASGFIGSHILRELTRRGHTVRACVRNPVTAAKRFPGPEYVHADFSTDTEIASWRDRLIGIDVVINAVGIIRETSTQRFDTLHHDAPTALFRTSAEQGVSRVIQISALGADESAQSHYHLSKRAADDYLAELPLQWVILRPSIVYGPGAKSMALFRALSALPLTPLISDGSQPVQPIHIDDLLQAVVKSLDEPSVAGKRIDLVGPQPVTLRELLQQQRHWLGLGGLRTIKIPYSISLRLAGIAGFFGSAPVDTDTVTMLQRGNTGDVKPFSDIFGFKPRSMEHSLRRVVAGDADRWYAGLYFLRPLLRIALAVMWLMTGLTSAFFFPAEQSYALLVKTGIEGALAPVALYSAATLDMLLGLALLFSIRVRLAALLQITLMLTYSIIITFTLPEFWLHPFGPLSKNLPLIVATLMLIVMERR